MFVLAIMAVVGVVAIVSGVVGLLRAHRFAGRSRPIEATLVSWREEEDPHDLTRAGADYPTVRFLAPDGRMIETEAEISVSYRSAEPGGAITVLYDPADPYRVRVPEHGGHGYLVSVISVVGGVFFLVVAVMAYL